MSELEGSEGEFQGEWWYRRKWLRRAFAPLLYITSWKYRLWKYLSQPIEARRKRAEREAKKIRKRYDFPRYGKQDLVGRDAEFEQVMLSVYYHVVREPDVRKVTPFPPPKLFIIKGGSGSGKTFFAEAVQREAFETGVKHGLVINYGSLKPEQVYSMWYGQSAQRLSEFFNNAFYRPSVILIDEFQAFGKKFTSMTETGMEEARVQTVFLEKIDELQKREYRTVVLVSTTEYESLLETLRRRGLVGTIDLDAGMTKEVLVEISRRWCDRYKLKVDPAQVVDVLEDAVRALGATELTPADVVNAFNLVVNLHTEDLRKSIISRILSIGKDEEQNFSKALDNITLNDFRLAARKLKAYAAEERTDAAKRSMLRIKPRESYKDVGGLHGVKEEIIKEISLALNRELALKARYMPPRGFVFYGPPGTGKTLLAKSIAGENGVWFYNVNGPSILQGKYGDPEKTIRDIFEDARKNAPAIVYFDEIDSIAPRRGTADPILDRVTSQLLMEIDGFVPLTGVVVIGSTNRLEALDPALIERFTKQFEFTYPKNRQEKCEIIGIHLRKYVDSLSPEVNVNSIYEVLEKKVLSPRRIANVIDDANRLRVKEIEAAMRLAKALKGDQEKVEEVKGIFKQDIGRLFRIKGLSWDDPELAKKLSEVEPSSYGITLFHFEEALSRTADEGVEEARELVESSVRFEVPEVGKAYGMVALGEGGQTGGLIVAVEVVVNPNGRGEVVVVGSEVGESIRASAQDAFIHINSLSDWRFKNYDVYVELVSPAKGMEKQVVFPGTERALVSGPSAGLAIGVAMLSAFLQVKIDPTVVLTGAITAKGEVWPVGGLDYRGMGKVEAALADKYVKRLVIPHYNYEKMMEQETLQLLERKGIQVIPVRTFVEATSYCLAEPLGQEELAVRLRLTS